MKICPLGFAMLSLILVGASAVSSYAQMDIQKALVGEWKGQMRRDVREKFENKRTLVIESVREEGGVWHVVAKFGVPGREFGPVDVKMEVVEGTAKLEFRAASSATVRLGLVDENKLIGTWVRAGPFRVMTLEKEK
jgi:hypothetical protein